MRVAALVSCAVIGAAAASSVPDTHSRIRGSFFGSLVGDALCLGSHYEYDASTIKQAYGGKPIDEYLAPGERLGGTTHGVGWGRRNYHPGQKKGDQTDYGEYTILMLEHLAGRKDPTSTASIDLDTLIPVWRKSVSSPDWGAWLCTQTKATLEQVKSKTPNNQLGGNSNAMAVRSAAALAVYADEDAAAKASRTMMFTHRSEEALSGGEFFTRVAHQVVHKRLTPREAIAAVAKKSSLWIQQQVAKGVAKYEEVIDPTKPLGKEEFADDLAMTSMARLWDVGKIEPIKVGKASPTEGTLPSSVYIILRYENDLVAALQANAMVGGDNASRGTAIGMVLGAHLGVESIPQRLQTTLNAWKRCDELLGRLPLLQQAKEEL